MGAAGLVALGASRPGSRWYALLLAATATLALNPRVLADPGWQLSFAAVIAILALGRPLRSALEGLPGPLAEGIAITVAATIGTAPLLAHHFGTVSLSGLPANVAAMPAVAATMWLGMLAAAGGQLAAAPVLDPLALALAACSASSTACALPSSRRSPSASPPRRARRSSCRSSIRARSRPPTRRSPRSPPSRCVVRRASSRG